MHCGRYFSSSSNRVRHERAFHKLVDDEPVTIAPEYAPQSRYDLNFPDNLTNTVEDVDDEEDEEDGTDGEESLEDGSDSEEKPNYWRNIVMDAIEAEGADGIRVAKQVLQEPFLSGFVNAMKGVVEEKIQFVKYMEEEDETYQKINDTIDRFEREAYDRDEAVSTAWHDRRFLVSRVIEENLDLIENELKDGDEENDGMEAAES